MAKGKKTSAGLLMYRGRPPDVEVFLVHPGGPFYKLKDLGAWGIPKGEYGPGEDPIQVACREFEEETGRGVATCGAPGHELVALGAIQQKSGKVVSAWAFEGDWPAGAEPTSNTFTIEWPPGSGHAVVFPEVDRAGFFPVATARAKMIEAQVELVDRLLRWLAER